MTIKKLLLSAAVLCAISTSVMAQDMDNNGLSGHVALKSDYVFRGISKSDEHPAVQGSVNFNHESGVHAGVWGSNVDFDNPDDGSIEVDVYAGFENEFNGFVYDAGGIYYAYPGSDSDLDYDFFELYFNGSYDFDIFGLTGGMNYSPEYFGDTGTGFYYYGGVDVPLPHEFGLAAHIGRQNIADADDYTDWSLGVYREWLTFDWAATYTDTTVDNNNNADARAVLSVSKNF